MDTFYHFSWFCLNFEPATKDRAFRPWVQTQYDTSMVCAAVTLWSVCWILHVPHINQHSPLSYLLRSWLAWARVWFSRELSFNKSECLNTWKCHMLDRQHVLIVAFLSLSMLLSPHVFLATDWTSKIQNRKLHNRVDMRNISFSSASYFQIHRY